MTVTTVVDADAIDFHGVPISLGYEPFVRDAFRALFSGFAKRANTSDALQIALRTIAEPITGVPAVGWRATFCHGLVQGYSRDGAHLLSDGQSRIEVFPRLGRMTGEVFEQSETDLSGGMQHIALSLLLRERDLFDLHAATATTDDRAFVLVGDSGAGKTTLLLALMELGCNFLGDDRLLFRAHAEAPELLAYPREFHLGPATLKLLKASIANKVRTQSVAGKSSLEPLEAWPGRFRRSWLGPISLLLPHIEPRAESCVRRVSAADAFGKLLSSSATVVVEAIDRRREQLESLKQLADRSDAYDVELGSDLLSDPAGTARRILGQIESLTSRP